jgi:hypothetical protein
LAVAGHQPGPSLTTRRLLCRAADVIGR